MFQIWSKYWMVLRGKMLFIFSTDRTGSDEVCVVLRMWYPFLSSSVVLVPLIVSYIFIHHDLCSCIMLLVTEVPAFMIWLIASNWWWRTTTTTICLMAISPLMRGLGSGFSHQSSPFYWSCESTLFCPECTTWFHVICCLPLPLTPSTSYNMLLESSSSFHYRCPSHLNQLLLTTSVTSSIPIFSFNSALVTWCHAEIKCIFSDGLNWCYDIKTFVALYCL